MNVAIDVDGTITRHPEQCRVLMGVLIGSGNRVLVLTGCRADPAKVTPAEHAGMQDSRAAQLAALGIQRVTHYGEIVVAVGDTGSKVATLKAHACVLHAIDLFLDDDEEYCRAVRQACPRIAILRVWP